MQRFAALHQFVYPHPRQEWTIYAGMFDCHNCRRGGHQHAPGHSRIHGTSPSTKSDAAPNASHVKGNTLQSVTTTTCIFVLRNDFPREEKTQHTIVELQAIREDIKIEL